jgi:hypothetical protein
MGLIKAIQIDPFACRRVPNKLDNPSQTQKSENMKLRALFASAFALALTSPPAHAEPSAVQTLSSQLSYMDPLALPSPDRLEAIMNETLIKRRLEPNEKSRRILGNILLKEQRAGVPGYDLLVCLHEGKPMEGLPGTPEELLAISAQVCSVGVKAYRDSKMPRTTRDDEAAIAGGLLVTWIVATDCSDLFFVKGGVIEQIAVNKGINYEPLQKAVWAVLFGQSSAGVDTELLNSLRKDASSIKDDIRLNHQTFCEQWGKIGLDWGSLGYHSKPPQN